MSFSLNNHEQNQCRLGGGYSSSRLGVQIIDLVSLRVFRIKLPYFKSLLSRSLLGSQAKKL